MAFLRGPIEPDEVVGREFSRVRRGYDPAEVREVLASLAAEIRRLTQTIGDLESTVSDLERRAVDPASLEPEVIASLLGEETVRVINAAREAAAEIRSKAEENAARVVRDAYERANRITREAGEERESARTDAASMLAAARTEADRLVADATTQAEHVRSRAESDAGELRGEAESVLGERTAAADAEALRITTEAETTRDAADEYAAATRGGADAYADEVRRAADVYSEEQRSGADAYASETRRRADEEAERRLTAADETVAARLAAAEQSAVAAVDDAREAGRQMLVEAREARERILRDLAERRLSARRQLEALRAGQEQLLATLRSSRASFDGVLDEVRSAVPAAREAADGAARSVVEDVDLAVEELAAELDEAASTGGGDGRGELTAVDAVDGPVELRGGDRDSDRVRPLEAGGEPFEDGDANEVAHDLDGAGGAERSTADGAGADDALPAGVRRGAEPDGEPPIDAAEETGEAGAEPEPMPEREAGHLRLVSSSPAPTFDDDESIDDLDDPVDHDEVDVEDLGVKLPTVPSSGPFVTSIADHAGEAGSPAGDFPAGDSQAGDFLAGDSSAAEASDGVGARVIAFEPPLSATVTDTQEHDVDALFARLRADEPEPQADDPEPQADADADADADASIDSTSRLDAADDPAAERRAAGDDAFVDLARSEAAVAIPVSEETAAGSSLVRISPERSAEILAVRDRVVSDIPASVARRLKREFADLENELLDEVRRARRGVDPVDLLPDADELVERFLGGLGNEIEELVDGAREFVDDLAGPAAPVSAAEIESDLRRIVGDALASPVSLRLGRAATQDDDGGDVVDRLRLAFREWRRERLADVAGDLATAVLNVAVQASLGRTGSACWVVDSAGAPCPDAEDNSLGGAVRCGSPFPTGDLAPPAHAGCRCQLVPVAAVLQTLVGG